MTLELHYVPGSFYAWRVQLALEHKGIAHDLKRVDFAAGGAKTDSYLAMNPRSKVPALRDGDFTLYESVAMLEYIEDKYPDTTKLYPDDVETRARVRRMICELDNYWFPHALVLVSNLYFKSDEADWNEEAVAGASDSIKKELEYYEGRVREDSFFGDITAADLAIYPMAAHLKRFDMRRPASELDAAIGPKFRRLMKRIESQPYFDKTFPSHWK